MRIILADEHVLFREGLAHLLSAQSGMIVVGSVDSVAMVVTTTINLQADLILMDFVLADGTGLEATQAILKHNPDCFIIFLVGQENDERLSAALKQGAKGYLLKNVSAKKLVSLLRNIILDGATADFPSKSTEIPDHSPNYTSHRNSLNAMVF